MARGCALSEKKGMTALVKGGAVVFYVKLCQNVLVAQVKPMSENGRAQQLAMNAVCDDTAQRAVDEDTLMGFHVRLGHLALDTIE